MAPVTATHQPHSSSSIPSVNLPDHQELLKGIQGISASLARDNHGPEVTLLQHALYVLGHFPPERKRDGHFGPITQKAVGDFQLLHNVLPQATAQGFGVFGPKTKNALVGALWNITKESSTPPHAASSSSPTPLSSLISRKTLLQVAVLLGSAVLGSALTVGITSRGRFAATDTTTATPLDQLEDITPGTIVEFKNLNEMYRRGFLIRSFDGKKYQIHPQFQLVNPTIPMNPKDPTTFRVVRKSVTAK